MRDYELVMIISPEMADEEVPAAIQRVQQFISERGGEVRQVDHWGRRKLAYSIQHFSEGNYVVSQFRLDPPHLPELESNLRRSEDIIRHLVVKLED